MPTVPTLARIVRVLALLAATTLAACATAPTRPPTYLLLGEVHDNPDGHQQRWRHLQALIESGWRPAIAMEQFDRERAGDLQRALAECPDAPCVVQRAGGPRWHWPHYQPVIELALRYRLPIVAANVSRADAMRAAKEGMQSAMPAQVLAAFAWPASMSDTLRSLQQQAIETGHCGQVPAAMLSGLIQAQVARDIWMAHVMLEHADRGVVLLAGNGHVRRDGGVPYWLRARGQSDVRSVGYVEPASQPQAEPYDSTQLVAPFQRPDPCVGLSMRSNQP